MAEYTITILRNTKESFVSGVVGESLLSALLKHDVYISAACGGKGRCGKCGVQMTIGATPIQAADRMFFDEEQLAKGMRLACEAYPQEDCRIVISAGDEADFEIVSSYVAEKEEKQEAIEESSYDVAIDIGTTTLAVSLLGATSKQILHTVTGVNHQRAYGADVISRIQASNDGLKKELQNCIKTDLYESIRQLLEETSVSFADIGRIAIAGNTTMGHLLMGYSCETLGVFPFTPVDIRTTVLSFEELFGDLIATKTSTDTAVASCKAEVILLPGISTYVGADIAAGLLCCEFDTSNQVNVLVDLGTNGEMAIGNQEKILVTSTAAGPAFEGGNISCGMGSVQGAICQLSMNGTEVTYETIGQKAPVGLCGTGVIETVYELLKEEWIDETGLLDDDYFDDGFVLTQTPDGEDITFIQKDVREIQLAKSAVRAGLETLLLRYGVTYEQIGTLYLAGGFGFRMDLKKAVGIGLLPEELLDKTVAVGNSSLGGAVSFLTGSDAQARMDKIIAVSEEISLGADKDFNQFYTDYMFFE